MLACHKKTVFTTGKYRFLFNRQAIHESLKGNLRIAYLQGDSRIAPTVLQ